MSQGAHVKSGRVYVIRFYSPKWKQNAFYMEKIDGEPKYTKELAKAREYKTPHNAKRVADQLTEQKNVVHRPAIRY